MGRSKPAPGDDPFYDSLRDAPLSPAPVELRKGARIAGRYEIEALLGSGGMGVVYKAAQLEVGRTVALKVLHRHEQRLDLRARFQREAIFLSRLQHVHIVTLFDAGVTEEGLRFLVMEYLDGRSLSATLKQHGALDPRRAVRLATQICDALAIAHQTGIIHRDLKPSNVQLIPMGREPEFVKLLDFGIARFLSPPPDVPGLTHTRQIMGTPRYMAPEQIRGEPLDPRTDLYALGCALYEMLAGRPPFLEPAEMALLERHLSHAPPRFAEANPKLAIDGELEGIVRTLLAKRPGDRFPSAEAVSSALALWSARAATESAAHSVPVPDRPHAATRDIRPLRDPRPDLTAVQPQALDAPVEVQRTQPIEPVEILHAPQEPTSTPRDLLRPPPRPRHAVRAATVLAIVAVLSAGLVSAFSLLRSHPTSQPEVKAAPAVVATPLPAPVPEITHPRPPPRIRARNVQVEHGPIAVAEVASAIEVRAPDLVQCFERTQRGALRARTLRLRIMSSEGTTSLRAQPRDAASESFVQCVSSLEPPLPLPVSRTRAIHLYSVDVGPGAQP